MVALICFIFSNILPDLDASALQITVAVLITLNTTVSEWLTRRGVGWETAARDFVAMAAINAGLAIAMWLIPSNGDGSIHLGNTLFFLLLITLIITLYDRFQPYSIARRVLAAPVAPTSEAHGNFTVQGTSESPGSCPGFLIRTSAWRSDG